MLFLVYCKWNNDTPSKVKAYEIRLKNACDTNSGERQLFSVLHNTSTCIKPQPPQCLRKFGIAMARRVQGTITLSKGSLRSQWKTES